MRVVDVPGVSGRAVTIVAAARLADGGRDRRRDAHAARPRRARPRIVVVRLRHDGLVDTSFGVVGGRDRAARARRRPRRVARDRRRGRSRPAGARGSAPPSAATTTGAVLALDGRGRRVRRFGTARSCASTATRPRRSRCRVRQRAAGRRGHAATVHRLSGAPARSRRRARAGASSRSRRCRTPTRAAARRRVLGSLALAGANRLVLGGSGGGSCPTRVAAARRRAARPVRRDGRSRAAERGGRAGAARRRDGRRSRGGTGSRARRPVRTAVAAAGAPLDLCAGVERDGDVRLVRVAASPAGPASRRRCRRARWTAVHRHARGRRPARRPRVRRAAAARGQAGARGAGGQRRRAAGGRGGPGGLRAGAIYRCKRHVLVVGTRRRGGVDRASVAVTSIVRR